MLFRFNDLVFLMSPLFPMKSNETNADIANTCQDHNWYGIHPVKADMHCLIELDLGSKFSAKFGLQVANPLEPLTPTLWPQQYRHSKIVLKGLDPQATNHKSTQFGLRDWSL